MTISTHMTWITAKYQSLFKMSGSNFMLSSIMQDICSVNIFQIGTCLKEIIINEITKLVKLEHEPERAVGKIKLEFLELFLAYCF
jgi:hypothetical protein